MDYRNAIKIYGKDLGCIKGKTVRSKPQHVKVDVTSEQVKSMKVVLSIDLMSFTGITFLVTVARDVRFITTSFLQDRRKATILKAIRTVVNLYKGKGHTVEEVEYNEYNNPVHTILADNEFETLRQDVESSGTKMNVTAKNEHVPEVERQHRVIKERARAIVQTLPYKGLPRKVRIGLIYYVVYWLNNVPKIGQDFSPKDLIFGEQRLDYNNICKLPFGSYVQVHDDLDVTNNTESRTTGAINLGPARNLQGTDRFYSLKTGEIVVRRKWTELPVPSDVIERLDDLTLDKSDCEQDLYDNIDQEIEENGNVVGVEEKEQQVTPVIDNREEQQVEIEDHQMELSIEENVNNAEHVGLAMNNKGDDETIECTSDGRQLSEEEYKNNQENEEQVRRYDLQPRRDRDFSYRFAMVSVKVGLEKWGGKAKDALLDELNLFIKEEVFEQVINPTKSRRQVL